MKSKRSWWVYGIISTVVLGVATVVGVWYWYNQQLLPVATSGKEQVISINTGASATEVATLLETEGIIRSSTAFELYTRRQNVRTQLQAGTYLLEPTSTMPEIIDKLVAGDTATRRLTIIEGSTIGQIRQKLLDEGYSIKQVDDLFQPEKYQISLLDELPEGLSLEGYIFPETYLTGYLEPPRSLIGLGLMQMQQQLTDDLIADFNQQGLTIHEALTLASIVEREATGDQTERRQIAQVFLSRLKQDEPLGADITACYAAELAGELKPGQSCDNVPLSIDSEYNTRLSDNTGLPPGPIGAPSASSLAAVANPAKTDYLFYFHGDDGVARFSTDYQKHLDKIEQFCQQNCG